VSISGLSSGCAFSFLPFNIYFFFFCPSVIMATIFTGFQTGTIAAYLLSPAIMDYFGGDWRKKQRENGVHAISFGYFVISHTSHVVWFIHIGALFYVYGTFGVGLLLPWLVFAKDSPKPLLPPQAADATTIRVLGKASEDKSNGVTWETSTRIFRDAPWGRFFQSKGVWAMLLAHCSKNWGLYNTLAWTPTFYAEIYGLGVRDSAWLSVLPSVAGAVGGLLAGNVADALIRHYSSRGEMNEQTLTNVRKLFQSVALFGPALALGTLAMDIPTDPVVAQCFLMVAVGLQAFTTSGFESANQEKAGVKWAGLLYSVTSLPAVMVGTAGVYTVGRILDVTGQDWSIVFGVNAIVNVLGGTAFLALYNSKREFD
jgi:MFS transporter, ACS family, solute carrier family 17 (sodium-dependent inorganic phosphate cotransporter), other